MTREEPELFSDFSTSLFYVRPKCSEWLEFSMQSNLGRYDLQYGALT